MPEYLSEAFITGRQGPQSFHRSENLVSALVALSSVNENYLIKINSYSLECKSKGYEQAKI